MNCNGCLARISLTQAVNRRDHLDPDWLEVSWLATQYADCYVEHQRTEIKIAMEGLEYCSGDVLSTGLTTA